MARRMACPEIGKKNWSKESSVCFVEIQPSEKSTFLKESGKVVEWRVIVKSSN